MFDHQITQALKDWLFTLTFGVFQVTLAGRWEYESNVNKNKSQNLTNFELFRSVLKFELLEVFQLIEKMEVQTVHQKVKLYNRTQSTPSIPPRLY